MTARMFRDLPRIFMRSFGEEVSALWARNDGASVDLIDVIFNSAYVVRSADGIELTDPAPFAFVSVESALLIEPLRAVDLSLLFRNEGRDQLIIGGRAYGVESCTEDSHGMCTIELIEPKAA
ncbi:head-tail joining protein [Pararhizobium sp.]|uniref:head-tail joining protein n=1 Tax=Pararhizobium sp. TaxID=1977563 RepID=UPI003D12824B